MFLATLRDFSKEVQFVWVWVFWEGEGRGKANYFIIVSI